MNLIDLIQAHVDGFAKAANTKTLIRILDRYAVKSKDNGCETARTVLRTIDATSDRSDTPRWDALVRTVAEEHLAVVARLEAEIDVLRDARNRMERRNQELVALLEKERGALQCLADTAANLQDEVERVTAALRGIITAFDERERQTAELEAAAGKALIDSMGCPYDGLDYGVYVAADKRWQDARADVSTLRAAIDQARCLVTSEPAPAPRDPDCTCIDPAVLDKRCTPGPILMEPCPVHGVSQ